MLNTLGKRARVAEPLTTDLKAKADDGEVVKRCFEVCIGKGGFKAWLSKLSKVKITKFEKLVKSYAHTPDKIAEYSSQLLAEVEDLEVVDVDSH